MKPLTRFVSIVVGSVAYLGLAVLGWGGVAVFLTRPPLIALMIAFAMLMVAAFFAGGNLSPGVREDRGNRWVIAVFAVVGLLNGYLPALTDRYDFLTLDGDAVRWIGVALFIVGGVLRLWPVCVLSDRFSGLVAIQPGHTLVTTGIYRAIRPSSQLSRVAHQLAWLEPGVSLGRWGADDGAAVDRAHPAHERRGTATQQPIRHGVRDLPRAHVATHSRG